MHDHAAGGIITGTRALQPPPSRCEEMRDREAFGVIQSFSASGRVSVGLGTPGVVQPCGGPKLARLMMRQ